MGWFVYIRGKFECVRCQKASDTSFQTKLLKCNRENHGRSYGIGDTEEIDGLNGYLPIHPQIDNAKIAVVCGDWCCEYCGLNWQWTKITFDVKIKSVNPIYEIVDISTFRPLDVKLFDDVNYIESDLAELSGISALWPVSKCKDKCSAWYDLSAAERCRAVVAGYADWCSHVAGIRP